MANNPIDLLKDKVTPQVIQPDSMTDASNHEFNSKSALLDQFYPILLGIFAHQPKAFEFALEHADARFSDIFAQQATQASLNQLLEEFSRHHNLSVDTIKPLLDQAVPLSAQALQNDIAPTGVVEYLKSYLPVIVSSIPAWAVAILSSLGLVGLFSTSAAAVPPIVAPLSTVETTHHMPVEPTATKNFKDQLPWWLGLAALLILALLLLRACQHEDVPPPMDTTSNAVNTAQASIYPASLSMTVGNNNGLASCNANAGDAALNSTINTALAQVFGAQKICNTQVHPAYSNMLTGQDKMQSIFNLVKPYANTSLVWIGNQLSINAPDSVVVNRLVGQIKAIAPELTVVAAAPLNIDEAVNSSIAAANNAFDSMPAAARAEDVARALNLQIINFAVDSTVIPDVNKTLLDRAATIIKQAPDIALDIQGYTDSTGDAAYNQGLSERRAQAVQNYLVSQGVNASKLSIKGFGQDNPVADNVTEQGKFRNRRIEFRVMNTDTGNTTMVDPSTAVTSTAQQATIVDGVVVDADGSSTTVIAEGSGSAPVINP